MANDTQQINPDVKLAFDAINAKRPRYNLAYAYYEGHHPLKYSASRLKKAFENLDAYFSQNWISVIVDSVLDRLTLKGFDVSEHDDANSKIDELWKEYNIQLIADDVHESAIITGEAFVIAQRSESEDESGEALDIYYNDPRMCHVFYEFDRPSKKRFAAKLWIDEERFVRITLYYADHFEYYVSNKKMKLNNSILPSAASFTPAEDLPEEPNELGIIPVFHFKSSRASRKKDVGVSEIALNDAVNKLFADMMVSAEFSAFIQRVIIAQADPGNLQNIPGANWYIPAGDGKSQQASVQEFGGRNLEPFLSAIDKIATSLAIISRTPKHYFFAQSGDPSGEALIAMESPLVKKVKKRQTSFGVEWQNFVAFLLMLENIKDIKRNQVIPLWEPAETVQPLSGATVTKTEVDSGMPLVTSLRHRGWTESDLKQLADDKKDEKKEMSGLAQDALDKLRAEDAQSNGDASPANPGAQNAIGQANTRPNTGKPPQ